MGDAMKLEQLLASLQKVRKTGQGAWVACCPAHEDRSPSLTIKATPETILLHCFSGCSPLEVLEAVGMGFEDLYPDSGKVRAGKPERFSPYQILAAIRDHSMYVGACAVTMRKRQLTEEEVGKLMKSAQVLQQAAEMGGV